MMPTSTIPERQVVIDDLHREIFPQAVPSMQPINNHSGISLLNDAEVHQVASNAKNRAKYLALYDGELVGYPSMSEGDAALACMYLFYTGGDVIQTERLLRASPRAQVDVKKRQDRADYWSRTIQGALSLVREFYKGSSELLVDEFDVTDTTPSPEPESSESEVTELERLRQENRLLRLEKRVLSNSNISPKGVTYLVILNMTDRAVRAGKANARGYVHLKYDDIAKSLLGRKVLMRLPHDRRDKVLKKLKDKITRHVAQGLAWGLLDKVNEEVWLSKDRKIDIACFRLHGSLTENLALLADYEPGDPEKRWGGPRPCKECGSQAIVCKEYCADCGALRREVAVDEDGNKTVHFDQNKKSKTRPIPYPHLGDSVSVK